MHKPKNIHGKEKLEYEKLTVPVNGDVHHASSPVLMTLVRPAIFWRPPKFTESGAYSKKSNL